MATTNQGLFGIFSGRIGSLIAYNYRGTQVFRTLPNKSTKAPTLAQQAQRMRFGKVINFLSPLKSIISKGYGNSKGKKTPLAQCMAYHTKQAITGTFPDFEINYSEVMLTTGKLCEADDVEMFSNRKACIDFSWTGSCNHYTSSEIDRAILVAYNPSQHRHQFLRTNSSRMDQFATLEVPMGFSGDRVHCWIIFVSPDGKEFSISTYVGSLIVA